MSDTELLYESLVAIEKSIYELAEARSYDWHMFWVGIASILSSLVVASFAYKLNKLQKDIAEKQSKISEEQAKITNKQADIMEQQNKIALFEKRYELYVVWSQFYYGAKKLERFIEIYSNDITGYYKRELFLKSAFFLFPQSSNNKKISEYEQNLYDHIVGEGLYIGNEPPEKDFVLFIDFESIGVSICESSSYELYTNTQNDFNEKIYQLRKIPKLFNLKSRENLQKIFYKIKIIQKNIDNNDIDFISFKKTFIDLISEIKDSRIREEMFIQIEIIN